MDAVEKAGNGHPGTAMSLAPAAYLLFQRVMRHDPTDPDWPGRDRFVLSCGHSSLTLYIQLYLSGYGLELGRPAAAAPVGLADPGPPRARPHRRRGDHHRPARPGPGQRGRHGDGGPPRARPVRPGRRAGDSPFDHHIYVICSDGDIEEGISHEVSSLAGHQQLGNLIVIWDDNQISIEDDTDDRQVRGRGRPLRGLRLARADGRLARTERVPRGRRRRSTTRSRRPRPRPTGRRSSRCAPSSAGRRRTSRTPARSTARRSARTRSRPPRRSSASTPSQSFAVDDEVLAHAREVRRPRPGRARRSGRSGSTPGRAANPERHALFDRLSTRTLPDGWTDGAARVPGRRQGHGHPQGLRRGARRDRARCCPSCGAARPTWPRATTPR